MDEKEYLMFKRYLEEIDIEETIWDAVYTAVSEALDNATIIQEDATKEDLDKIFTATSEMIKSIIMKIKLNK